MKTLVDYLEQVEEVDVENIKTLNRALEIVESFDSFSSNTGELTSLLTEVRSIKNSDTGQSLNQQQQSTLTDLETTLSIAAKLSPESVSSEKISHYLDILKL